MTAALPVGAQIPRCELAAAQDFVRLRLGLGRELLVDRARVDQQGRLRFCSVFLGDPDIRVGVSAFPVVTVALWQENRNGGKAHLKILWDLEEGRVRDGDDLDLAREREVEPGTRAVAEADRGELGNPLRLEGSNQGANGRQYIRGGVFAEPAHEVVGAVRVERVLRERVVVEVVWNVDLEAVARKVIGQKLIGEGKSQHRVKS